MPGRSIDALNQLDDAFSAASKASFTKASPGDLVATIKLIPYGIPATILEGTAISNRCCVKPFAAFSARLIVSCPNASEKTVSVLEQRLQHVGGNLADVVHCDHGVSELEAALRASSKDDLTLILGASAISDMNDVIPAAVQSAGGKVIKLGMPADPGNLLMLAEYKGNTIIGLPGCARSPALNGFDWVLERFSAGLALDKATISALGTGGLLKEPVGRRAPRQQDHKQGDTPSTSIAAIVLAAGKSSRAGTANKLLSKLGDTPVVRATVDTISKTVKGNVFVVTGAWHQEISKTLDDVKISTIHNDLHGTGMGTSIAKGFASLPDDVQFSLVCLGDMPFVKPETYTALIDASSNYGTDAIFIPTFHGKRGHPVMWGQQHFRKLCILTGDIGGKPVLAENQEKIIEVAVDDPGILIDLDTPEMLTQFGVTPISP